MTSWWSPVTSSAHGSWRGRPLLLGGVALAAGLVTWWLVAEYGGLPGYVLPAPLDVWNRFIAMWATGSLPVHTAQTLAEVLQGAAIGLLAGVLLAMLFHHVRWIQRLLMPLVVIAQVTPKISIAPLIVLWIGLGIMSKIALVALVVFYPVLINMLSRLDAIPSSVRDLAVVLGMGSVRRAVRIELPATLPAIAAGLRVGLLMGVTAAVIGEFIGAKAGLGYLEKQGQSNDDIQVVFIALFALCALGCVLYLGTVLVERILTRRYA